MRPDRSRAIAFELALPIVEYVEKTLAKGTPGVLTQTDFEAHASEFFDLTPKEMDAFSKSVYGLINLYLRTYIPLISAFPDAAATVLAGYIQSAIIEYDLKERVLVSD